MTLTKTYHFQRLWRFNMPALVVIYLRFYNSTQFTIMNGRWEKGVNKGKFTCINPEGSSIVDYCLVGEGSLDIAYIVKEFRIGDFDILFRLHHAF